MVFTGININRAWKDDNTWFGEYTGAYVLATLGELQMNKHMQPEELKQNLDVSYQVLKDSKMPFNKSIADPDFINRF